MSSTTQQFAQSFAQWRRQFVKGIGRSLLQHIAGFFSRQSLIGATPRFDPAVFAWIPKYESRWREIAAELEDVLRQRAQLQSFHDVSPDQQRISKGDDWKVFPFFVFGDPFAPNCARCPVTAQLLADTPDIRNAMFSILSPHTYIPAHRGPTNGIIRIHLGLIVPGGADTCRIRVDDQLFGWEEGKCVVFDDYFEHEVWNDTEHERVVLFFDVDRPMRARGRWLNKMLIAIFKRTAYIEDAKNNIKPLQEPVRDARQQAD